MRVTQGYMMSILHSKGTLYSIKQPEILACLIVSMILELQKEGAVTINAKKQVLVRQEPETSYLKPLYFEIQSRKLQNVRSIAEAYILGFSSGKKEQVLIDGILETLVQDGYVEEVYTTGLLKQTRKKYMPKLPYIAQIAEQIQQELLGDHLVKEDTITLALLLNASRKLQYLLPKETYKDVQRRLKQIKDLPIHPLIKETVNHIEGIIAAMTVAFMSNYNS